MRNKLFLLFFLIGISFLIMPDAEAQCAMCRATVENNISSGGRSFGAGLNKGILYLMVMPYIAIATIAFFWLKQSKKDRELKEKIMNRLKLG